MNRRTGGRSPGSDSPGGVRPGGRPERGGPGGGPDGPGGGDGTPPHGTPPPEVSEPRSTGAKARPEEPRPRTVPLLGHDTLKSLLGAWALAGCSAEEAAAVEQHLGGCSGCASEAARLRAAVALLRQDKPLDLDPLLRARVLEGCLGRRPAKVPVPSWAAGYDAETARLDALLGDLGPSDWDAPVTLGWHGGSHTVPITEVVAHLAAVDGLLAVALAIAEPLGRDAPRDPAQRTEAYWRQTAGRPPDAVREDWREQSHALLRTACFAGRGAGRVAVDYGAFRLPLRDSFVDRAFECWIHAEDIASAVDYPYDPPAPAHLHLMIDLAARMLPDAIAERRRAGLASSPGRLVAAGAPGRSVHLEVEGLGGGHWVIPIDSPAATPTLAHSVAHVAMEGTEFCRLAAGRRAPGDLAAGHEGDRQAVHDLLSAAADLSRL